MSTRQLTDVSALITDTYTYDAFGVLLNRSGSTENNYLYTGEQYDPNIGFYYLRARYYNKNIGRFLTMDTWSGLVFEPLSLHKYLYCHDNPIDHLDPSGRWSLLKTLVVIGIVLILLQAILPLVSWYTGPEWTDHFILKFKNLKLGGWGLGYGHLEAEIKEEEPSRYVYSRKKVFYTGYYQIHMFGLMAGGGGGTAEYVPLSSSREFWTGRTRDLKFSFSGFGRMFSIELAAGIGFTFSGCELPEGTYLEPSRGWSFGLQFGITAYDCPAFWIYEGRTCP